MNVLLFQINIKKMPDTSFNKNLEMIQNLYLVIYQKYTFKEIFVKNWKRDRVIKYLIKMFTFMINNINMVV